MATNRKNVNKFLLLGSIPLIWFLLRRSMSKNKRTGKITNNFTWEEAQSHDGAVMSDEIANNVVQLAKNLQVIRDYINKPIKINSWYRSPEQNKKVSGSSGSYHMKGMAVDFYVPGMTTKEVRDIIELLIQQGKIKQGGIGKYDTWVHYDIRGTKARW